MEKQNNIIRPKTLPGFVELLPKEQVAFDNMYSKIKRSYEKFGFVPLDTPVLEYSEVLLAKAGGETEKQIYRFNKGDTDISMRFDLTVPLAKYVALNYGELAFPFKRYQIGKVYRGERAQKGRYREFYQADIDIIGDETLDLVYDAELPSVIYTTFTELGFSNFTIRINNRKVLNGLFEELNLKDKASDILRVIDKIDKIGKDAVIQMLKELLIDEKNIAKIMGFITISGTTDDKLDSLCALDIANEQFKEGVRELEVVIDYIRKFKVPESNFTIDLTIARGLDYYTGTVYETILNDYPDIGSVCSGGRYENLAGYYTNKKLPGVGISIGLSRLYYKLHEAGVIEAKRATSAEVFVIPMTEKLDYPLEVANVFRQNGINTEVSFAKKSMKSVLNYANRLGYPFVAFVGEDEELFRKVTIKNMYTSKQACVALEEITARLNSLLDNN